MRMFLNTDCTDYTDNLSGDAEINVDAWCLVSNTDCTDLTNYFSKCRGCWRLHSENKHYSSCLVTREEVTRNHLLL